jgi:hypothetical protein
MMMKYLMMVLFLPVAMNSVAQQNYLSHPISLSCNEVPLGFLQFLEQVEKEIPVRFFFHPSWINHLTVNQAYDRMPLRDVLDQVFDGSDISYAMLHGYAIIFVKDPARHMEREKLLDKAVSERKNIQQITIGNSARFHPDRNVTLRGTLTDENTSVPIKHGSVSLLDSDRGTVTNEQGVYELQLAQGQHLISFRHANYSEKIIDLEIYTSGRLDVKLEEEAKLLDEVIVSDQAIAQQSIGQTTIKVLDMKRAPSFIGEVDIIKQVQTQAGVTTVGEIAAGFNVRGGGVDQNLVLYDGMPIFNTAHAMGFFSAFNANVINQISFYRGGIPAEYGGRASSVLNVSSREGSYVKWSGDGGIGLISAHATIHGPIKKEYTSVIASFRTTYSNWMVRSIQSKFANIQNSSIAFFDGTLKIAHRFSAKSKLTFSAYSSNDQMQLINDSTFQWSNLATSVRWDKTSSENLFFSITAGVGKYSYQIIEPQPSQAFNLQYGVIYPTLKADFNYTKRRPVSFGLHTTVYNFNPGTLRPISQGSLARFIDMANERSVETALYFSESLKVGSRVFIDAGMRYSLYARLGSGMLYQYAEGHPREPRNVIDSIGYGKHRIMKIYHGSEPRLALRYSLNQTASIKVGYNRMYQFIHLISNTAAVTPVDVWQSSNFFFRPQIADQLAGGYFKNLMENTVELFGELFYKRVENILEFKDGAQLILNNKLETALLPGRLYAYGLELSATRRKGRLQGGVNYTWSRSWRKVNGYYDVEKINEGRLFPSNFDQPHVVNLMWRYGITRRHFFTGQFTYHTGRPISLPEQIYYVDGIGISDFPERNTYRLPDYHRLDLAFVIEGNHKRKKLWDGTWTVSFYNVYFRRNAYSVFFRQDSFGILKPYQLSVIGALIPTLTYNFKF